MERKATFKTAYRALLAATAFIASTGVLQAQSYPVKPMRMVLPLPPGGAIDIVGRSTGAVVAERLGQPMIFDNKPGANTIVATDNCVKSAADGYSLCFITSNLSLNQALYSKLPYDYIRDLDPITNLVFPWEGLFLSASVPANNMGELVAYSRANPGKLNFGSLGIGGSPHLVPEWVAKNTGASLTHIPFKGLPDLMRAFTAGEIHMFFLSLGNPGYIENIKAGKMKVMFFGGDKRNPIITDAPAMSESGVPDHGFKSWWGMAAPRGTPKEIIDRLHTVFVQALRTPAIQERFATMSLDIAPSTPAEFAKFMLEDRARGERLVRASGATLD
jgi:tripartite-type tricarboxylate transporter receptor subunit TctC